MKWITGTFAPFLFCLSTASIISGADTVAPSTASGAGADVFERDLGVIDTDEINLGEIDGQISQLRVRFRWLNKSNRVLTIGDTVSGCKCQFVELSTKSIAPGGFVEFHVVVNLVGVYGNGATVFLVKFSNDKRDPLRFKLAFTRPSFPHAEPTRIDFGSIRSSKGATRQFVIDWAASDKNTGVKLLDGITASDKRVQCRVVKEQQTKYRLPNTERESFRNLIICEAKVIGRCKEEEELAGSITIPLVYQGKTIAVTVPYHGQYAKDIEAHPARVVLLVAKDERRKETSIELCRGTDTPVHELKCLCSDSRVTIRLADGRHDAASNVIGKLGLTIDVTDGRSFDTEIVVHSADSSSKLHIPVRVRVVP